METKQNINDGLFRGYPLQQRLANITSRYRRVRSNRELWSIYAGLKTIENVDQESRKLLPKEFSVYTNGKETEEFTLVTKRLAGVLPQIRAAVVVLDDSIKVIETSIAKIKTLLNAQNFNYGFQAMMHLEKNEMNACERFVDHVNILIRERITQDRHVISNIIDLMVSDVYERVTTRAKEEHVFSSEASPLPPVFYTTGQSFEESQWSFLQQILWKQGRALPISLLPIAPRVRDNIWNVVRVYVQVCRKLYVDLGIDREIEQIVQNVAISRGLSPQATQLLQQWKGELVSEISASLIAGPAYAGASIELLGDSARTVTEYSATPYGVPTYQRWTAILSTLQQVGYYGEVEPYRRALLSFYGPAEFVASYPQQDATFYETLSCMETLVSTILNTPLMVLKGNTIREFFPQYEADQHGQAIAGANEILQKFGISIVSESANEPSSSTTSKVEKSSSRSTTKSDSKTSASKATTESQLQSKASAYIAACRFAFERVSLGGELPPEFEAQCKTYIAKALDQFYESPDGTRIQKEISPEDVHRLIRVAYVGARSQTPQMINWI